MAIKIGHASVDERGKAYGGTAGDSTGKEVCIRTWYSSPWDTVLRCKDTAKAEKMAKAMEAACNNKNIGYDQYQRNTLLTQAKACGWDMSKITTPCETDCSALVSVCAQCAGIDIPYINGNAPYTGNMKQQFTKTGEFEVLSTSKYLTSDAYLRRGDILLRTSGHTAMALENGAQTGGNPTSSNKNTTSSTIICGKIDTVKEVQIWLNNNYAAALTLDGLYGSRTKAALVKALQKELGFTGRDIDGDYGPKTNAAVKQLKRGSTGPLVKVLQGLLVCNGQKDAYIDGSFGPGTEKALKAVQKKYGIEVDGSAWRETFTALCK